MIIRTRTITLILAAIAGGCAATGQVDPTEIRSVLSKADADPAAVCESYGFAADCDLCEEADLYGDYNCDAFCPEADPDCSPIDCEVADVEISVCWEDATIEECIETYATEVAGEEGMRREGLIACCRTGDFEMCEGVEIPDDGTTCAEANTMITTCLENDESADLAFCVGQVELAHPRALDRCCDDDPTAHEFCPNPPSCGEVETMVADCANEEGETFRACVGYLIEDDPGTVMRCCRDNDEYYFCNSELNECDMVLDVALGCAELYDLSFCVGFAPSDYTDTMRMCCGEEDGYSYCSVLPEE